MSVLTHTEYAALEGYRCRDCPLIEGVQPTSRQSSLGREISCNGVCRNPVKVGRACSTYEDHVHQLQPEAA